MTVRAGTAPLALLMCAVLGLAGCSRKPDAELLAAARAQLEARDHASAIVTLKDALQHNEGLADGRLLLGRALLETGDAAGALLELRKAQGGGADAQALAPLLARALLATGQAQGLIAELGGTTLSALAAQADLKTQLALAHGQLRQRGDAEQALADALAADPQHAPALLLQARLLAGNGLADAAQARVQQVLGRQPRQLDALLLQAELLLARRGDRAAVEAAFGQVLAMDPRHLAAHAALVALGLSANDAEAARTRLAAMQKAWPRHPQTLALQARVSLLQGRMADARDAVQHLLRATPDDPRALHLAGEVEWRAGARLPAQTYLKNALSLAPQATPVRLLLAQVQLQGGDAAAVLATLAPLLQAAAVPADALGLAAQAQLLQGQRAQAQALFARAAQAAPQDPRYRTAVALSTLQKDGAKGLARLEALAAEDASGVADLVLVNARIQRQDFAGALQGLARAEARQPRNPALPLIRGQVHERLGDTQAARAAYEHAHRLDPQHLGAAQALGERDLADGQPQAALGRLQALVEAQPADARRRLALADLQRRAGAPPAEVQASIEAALRGSPTDLTPVLALVQHHLAVGQAQAALTVARSALVSFPAETELLAALGQAQLAAGEPQQAISSFRKLQSAQPRNPQALLALAQAQRAAGERQAARGTLQQALALAPALLPAHQDVLELALEDRQWPAALALARAQQQRQPQGPQGWLWEGAVHAAQRQWAPAAAALRTAVAKGGGSDAAQKLHSALLAGGQAAEADRQATDWLARHPQDVAFHLHLGDAWARRDPARAEPHYRRALGLQPAQVTALNNLAWVLVQQKKPGAAALAERANQLAPGQPNLMDTWATALAAEGKLRQAVDLQKQAVEQAPKRVELRLTLARLALQSGDKSLARDELQRLAELAPRLAQQAEVQGLLKAAQ